MKKPIKVTALQQTCKWVPAQWEGYTEDGRPIYVRYRHGRLCIYLGRKGQTVDEAVRGKELFVRMIGHPLDGVMAYAELKRHTRGLIEWPRTYAQKSLV